MPQLEIDTRPNELVEMVDGALGAVSPHRAGQPQGSVFCFCFCICFSPATEPAPTDGVSIDGGR